MADQVSMSMTSTDGENDTFGMGLESNEHAMYEYQLTPCEAYTYQSARNNYTGK